MEFERSWEELRAARLRQAAGPQQVSGVPPELMRNWEELRGTEGNSEELRETEELGGASGGKHQMAGVL